jgi:hypothetical protein
VRPAGGHHEGAGAMTDDGASKNFPSGIFGFLARLRDSGALARMPASWTKIMIALYARRNPQGFAWPSEATLTKDSGCNRRTINRFLKWAKVGLGIKISRKKSNSYYLPLDQKIDCWGLPGKRPRHKAKNGTAEIHKELRAEKGKNQAFS